MNKKLKLLESNKILSQYCDSNEISTEEFYLFSFALLQSFVYENRKIMLMIKKNTNIYENVFISLEIDSNTSIKQVIDHVINEKRKYNDFNFMDSLEYGDYKIDKECVRIRYSDYKDNDFDSSRYITNLKLNISIINEGTEIEIIYDFDDDKYNENEIDIMQMHYETLIKSILKQDCITIGELEVVSDYEKEVILCANQTAVEYSEGKCVHEVLERTTKNNIDKIALLYDNIEISYDELNKKTNQIARVLKNIGVKKGDYVGIIARRGIELIYAIYSVLKAGAAYVPIAANCPYERKEYILNDCNAKVILTTEDNVETENNIHILNLKKINVSQEDDSNLTCINNATDVAAVIYTSGTTGLPKGVLLRHDTIVNYCEYNLREFNIDNKDVIFQFAPFTFSTSIYEITTTLFAGAKLCLITDDIIADITKFHTHMELVKVTILLLPSEYCNYIIPTKDLKIIETGASECSKETHEKISKLTRHVNAYGLTEGSIAAVWKDVNKNISKKIPIGKPVANTKVYVLRDDKICGMYMSGELCVTGMAVSNGYLNNPELNEKVFVNNPFGNGKMLMTGDIVQWNYNGDLEYIGRKDNQVKIRGMRVEIEEVESLLKRCNEINNVGVICKEDNNGGNILVAFITSDEHIDIGKLKQILSKQMLSYMIPDVIYQIDEIPLTINGKVNKKILKNINIEHNKEYLPPRNELERKIKKIFQDILEIENVGIKESFFELGGHSLRAISAVNKIHLQTGVKISINDFFEKQTVENIAEFISSDKKKEYTEINKVEQSDYYEASSAQVRVFVSEKLENESKKYNLPSAIKIKGKVDIDKVEKSLIKLIERHEVFRTSFEIINDVVVQKIHEKVDFKIEYIENDIKLKEEIDNFIKIFDLSKPPLFRVKILKIKEEEYIVLFDMHHIISDGTSMQIIKREFSDIYNGKKLDELDIQYKDYSAWQNNQMSSIEIKEQLNYWSETLQGDLPVLNFPYDFPRPNVQNYEGSSILFEINNELTEKLNMISKETGTTLYMVLLAAYNVLLAKYTGQEDIIVGSPIAGRNHPNIGNLIGMFINTLPMRNYPKSDMNFDGFLQEVKANCVNAYKNSDCQFEKIVEKVNVLRDPSRNPLFDAMLVLQNMSNEQLMIDEAVAETYNIDSKVSLVDMTMWLEEIEGKIKGTMEYSNRLFCERKIKRFVNQFLQVLKDITIKLDKKIGEIEFVDENEMDEVLYKFNNTNVTYESEKTIQELFERTVEVFPEKIALVFNNESITYTKLNQEANKVANFLRKNGVKKNTIVGLLLKRTPRMFIGLLGILKAGGTYLPLDPEYPSERISYILQDSGTKYVLVDDNKQSDIVESDKKIDISSIMRNEENTENPAIINESEDGAYIIYTSGSTGNPKGVVISHKAVHNFIVGVSEKIEFNQTKTILNLTTISFDIFVLESIMPFIKGMKVVLCSEIEQLDAKKLGKKIINEKIDMIQATPSRMQLILESKECREALMILKDIMLGGEALTEQVLRSVKKYTKARIYNMYGPTETTVWSTINEQTRTNDITIGEPIGNTQVYIISKNGQIQPVGIPGELCISGDGLANCYYGKSELTKEKFISNSYENNKKMYKTGDLAYWREDGKIAYLGRVDFQVKIRGYRIELGEIENQVNKFDEIKENIVIVKEYSNGVKYLVNYYVKSRSIEPDEIRERIRRILPEYMIPSYFIELKEMQYTPNGKIDRKALTERELEIKNSNKECETPKSDYEKMVLEIWEEVLQRKGISLNDNFFESGGNSLLLVKVFNLLIEKISVNLQVADLFSNPTIKKIANMLQVKNQEGKEYQEEIQGLKLPEEFFASNSNIEREYKSFIINSDMNNRLKMIANENSVQVPDILFSMYILVLNKISKYDDIALMLKDNIRSDLYQIKMKMSKYKILENIFRDLNYSISNTENLISFSVDKICKYKSRQDEDDIIALGVYNSSLESSVVEYFDLVLNMDSREEKICITYEFNSRKIDKSKGEYIIDLYLNMLDVLIKNYKLVV